MRETLVSWISDRQSKLRELEDTRRELMAELRAFEATLALYDGTKSEKPTLSARGVNTTGRQRTISDEWKSILDEAAHTAILATDGIFTLEDVEAAAKRVGHEVTADNVRSQMATYTNRGILERFKPGTFALTAQGAVEIGAPDDYLRKSLPPYTELTSDRPAPRSLPSWELENVETERGHEQ